MRLALIIGLLLTVVCQPTFQERAVYLSQSDNVCHFDAVMEDQLYLIINMDGSPSEKIQTWGMTSCLDKGWTDA